MSVHNQSMETIKLPRKPRLLKKEQAPDMRQFAVVPIRAITDRNLTEMQLRTLLMFCAYSNRGGLTWVGLKRIAEHFGLTMNTAAIHTRQLIKKGYMRVLYHGYKGERAHTRQIVFKADMKLEDIIAISGESAPYLQENQPLTTGAKGESMSKKRKTVLNKGDSKLESVGNDYQLVKDDRESQLETIRRAVGEELFSIAEQEAGKNATLADIERILAKMLA
jgi:DNA-binding MarR family transcriptional regulator